MKTKETKAYFWFALLTALMILSSCEKEREEEYCECQRENRIIYLDTKFKTIRYDLPYKVACQEPVEEWTIFEFVYDRDLDQSIERQFIITCK